MKKIIKTNLVDITRSFSSNDDGLRLYIYMDKVIKSKDLVVIKIENDAPMSSSFLNSSFGEILNIHGIKALKSFFKIETSSKQFNRLNIYIQKYLHLDHA